MYIGDSSAASTSDQSILDTCIHDRMWSGYTYWGEDYGKIVMINW